MLALRLESIICDFQICAEIIAHKERFANKRSFTAMFSSFLLIDTLILFSSLNIYILFKLNLERIHRKQAHPKTGFVMFIRWLRLFHFLCVLGLQLELLLTLSVYASSAFKSYSKDTIFSDVNINVILLNIFSNYNKAHRCYDSSDLYICI